MKNVTITVPDSVAKWARAWAARNNTSVSKLVGELLTARMKEETAYDAAMKHYHSKSPQKLRNNKTKYPKRDTLYDR